MSSSESTAAFSNHQLTEEPIEDLLLALEVQKQSGELHIESPMGVGRISMRSGFVVNAEFGNLNGPEAIEQVLALKVGKYRVAQRPVGTGSFHQAPSELIRNRTRRASTLDLVRSRPSPSVRATLERTAKQLPTDLSAVELRALAAVNGKSTALEAVVQVGSDAATTLSAVRNLHRRGLIKEITASTLALGTRKVISETSSTLAAFAAVTSEPEEEQHPESTVIRVSEPSMNAVPVSSSSEGKELASTLTTFELDARGNSLEKEQNLSTPPQPPKQKQETPAVPARFAKQKAYSSGYSSVPPPSLAEEKVSLPSAMRRGSTPSNLDQAPTDSTGSAQDRQPDPKTGQPKLVLGVKSPFKTASTTSSEERDSESFVLVPSSPPPPAEPNTESKGDHVNDPTIDITTSEISHVAPSDSESDDEEPRTTMFDDLVVEAAQGQLSDSEMPVPSSRLGDAALAQLGELNEAIGSSRKPKLPHLDEDSTEKRNPPSPGSVPHD